LNQSKGQKKECCVSNLKSASLLAVETLISVFTGEVHHSIQVGARLKSSARSALAVIVIFAASHSSSGAREYFVLGQKRKTHVANTTTARKRKTRQT